MIRSITKQAEIENFRHNSLQFYIDIVKQENRHVSYMEERNEVIDIIDSLQEQLDYYSSCKTSWKERTLKDIRGKLSAERARLKSLSARYRRRCKLS